MSLGIKESDWKRFKEVHQIAMERFDQKCLQEAEYHLTDKAKSATERFFEVRDIMRDRNKQRATLFDDYRRSTAWMQIAFMRAHKLITDEEMLRFSEDLQDRVAHFLQIARG